MSPSRKERPSGSISELTVQTCRSTSQPRSRPTLKKSLNRCDRTSTFDSSPQSAPPRRSPSLTLRRSATLGRGRGTLWERERARRLNYPALDDRIAGIDDLGGPDQARDAVPGSSNPLDDVAEDAADLRDLLPRLDAVADLDLQVDQPAAAGTDGELVHRAQRVSADD